MSSRSGLGIDVHPLVEGRALVLGSVTVPHDRGLSGHSDGDVLILVWGNQRDTETACQEIAIRAEEATVGIPSDTRQPLKDGTNGFERVLPGVRRACDEYVRFVEEHDLLESVAASLTEMFAGDIMKLRIAAFEKHYAWVDSAGLRYFRKRTQQDPRDATWGLDFVLREARARQDQERHKQRHFQRVFHRAVSFATIWVPSFRITSRPRPERTGDGHASRGAFFFSRDGRWPEGT